MKAYIVDKYGKGTRLRLGEIPVPALREDDVLVEVHATAVNVLDVKIRNGDFRPILPYRVPFVLGHDVAGVVVAVGAKVRQFKIGDEVFSRPDDFRIGTFAEFIAIKEQSVAIKPHTLTMEEAASIPLVGLTAWQALVDRAGPINGKKVLIQAGSGGVGTFAIQLAKHLGATVATTASAANAALVTGLGADVVIDYRKDDVENVLHDYDVVLHSQDAATLAKSLRVLKPGGKLISISGPPDAAFAQEARLPWFMKVLMRALSFGARRQARRRAVHYEFLFMKPDGSALREIAKLIDAGQIRPVIDRVFSFEDTNAALALVEAGRAKGKVGIKLK